MAFTRAPKQGDGNYPAKWDKEVHKVIVGTLIEKKYDIMGKPGSNAFVIQTGSGELYTVWSSKILDDYFSTIENGTVVRIEYMGKKKSKNGVNSFNDYTVDIGEESDLEEALPWEKN
jgi:hypothetical protein